MLARVLHISDLHVGTREEPAVEPSLAALVEELAPEIVIASGDLSHRGRRAELERAAAFLRGLGRPLLAVPGNHDIPRALPGRLARPFAEFERCFETAEPVYSSDAVHAVGLNSVRPWHHQSGGLDVQALARAAEVLAEARPGALRIVALHHHPIGAPMRSFKRPLARREQTLAALLQAGAELVVCGHIHQAAVAERREFEVTAAGEAGLTVSVAPGLGQPRPRRRGEARGLHVYEIEQTAIGVRTYAWQDGGFALCGLRRFPRGRAALAG